MGVTVPAKENNDAFLRIQTVLEDAGLRVPYQFAADLERGFLLMEDFGDSLLLSQLSATTVDAHYTRALEVITRISTIASDQSAPRFDEARITEELGVFPEWFLQQLLGFDEAQLAALQQLLISGDVIFAWGYGLVFFGVLGLLTARLSGRWQRVGAVIMWAPLLASLFDVFEDIGLHRMVTTVAEGGTGILPAVVLLTTISASLKYLFLAVVAPAYGVAGAVKAFKTDRRLRSIGLYVFVALVAYSMMQKPFSEIPACF